MAGAGLGIRAYARHRGVSHTAVQKALRAGRIQAEADGSIDPVRADRAWAGNTAAAPAAPAPPQREEVRSEEVRDVRREPAAGPSFAQSRAIREAYAARLAKLEYEERTGALVRTEQVKLAWFDLLRVARDRLLNIPDRLADTLAAETEPRRVRELLAAEIRLVLTDLADQAERQGGAA